MIPLKFRIRLSTACILPLMLLAVVPCFRCDVPVPTPTKLKQLLTCLLDSGIPRSNIITRSRSSSTNSSKTAYSNANFQWNTFGGPIRPLAFLLSRNTGDVQAAVWCSRASGVRVVAKSGGHSYTKSSFGDSNSLIVDLHRMNEVSINGRARVVTVGPGARVGSLAYQLWAGGRWVTSLGICPVVGISGLALGGGYGYLARLYGLTTDNIVEMQMVTARGSVLTVNNVSNTDLYFALRGAGGGSFGIVTSFKLKLYPAPSRVLQVKLKYNFGSFPAVFEAYQSLLVSDLPSKIHLYFVVVEGVINMIIVDVQNTPTSTETVRRLVDQFPKPTNSNSNHSNSNIKIYSWPTFLVKSSTQFNFYDDPAMGVHRPSDLLRYTHFDHTIYFEAKTFYVNRLCDRGEIRSLFELLQPFVLKNDFYLEQYGGAISQVPNSETAFVHRAGILYDAKIFYTGMRSDSSARALLAHLFDKTKELLQHTGSYQNYADAYLTDYLERYNGANLERLVHIKARVDPENVFHNPASIPTNWTRT